MLHLLNCNLQELAQYIKQHNLKIIVYGAGMIGKIVVPDYLSRNDLLDNMCFYVDMDKSKQKQQITIEDKKYGIYSEKTLEQIDKSSIFLITNSNYSSVIGMLDIMENLDGVQAAIIPVIQTIELKSKKLQVAVLQEYSKELIPKVIHYCWFSGKEMPDYLKKCVDSWHRFCPDYEIKRWDESNYDVCKNTYMRQAYEEQKWGFVPDYARLDILYNYGGFYLDTDVELIKSLDGLRGRGAFCGVEKWGNINMGGCSGAVSKHPMIKKMLDYREGILFQRPDGTLNLETCGVYETKPFIDNGMVVDNTIQQINNMTVFPSEFFHPYDYMSGETYITSNTYSIHHFNGGWLDEKRKDQRKRTAEAYKNILKRMQV